MVKKNLKQKRALIRLVVSLPSWYVSVDILVVACLLTTHLQERRIELLGEVSRLALSLGLSGEHGYTCETAGYFFLYHVLSRWEPYEAMLAQNSNEQTITNEELVNKFPFGKFK
jgi:hypothetical protein